MQLSNIPAKLLLAFAAAGGRNTIPVDSQISTTPGAASFTDGFPPLTRTPIVAGGIPPSGLDMNGVLYELSALLRWLNAGGGFPFDATFAGDVNVGGYPKGARVMRSDGKGYWLNTLDNNGVDPESVTVGEAAGAGWVPDYTSALAAVTMTNANVTLTPTEYGKPVIVLTGTLTANLNLIFPNLVGEWTVLNACSGEFAVTCKTAAGAGVKLLPSSSRVLYGDGSNIAVSQSRSFSFAEAPGGAIGTPTTVSLAQAGSWFQVTNTVNVTLPSLAKAPLGTSYTFTTSTGFTLKGDGTDNIQANGGLTVTNSLTVLPGESLTVVANGSANGWYVVIDGFGATGFNSSFAGNGYQKLPTGLIIQWGRVNQAGQSTVVYSLPIAFPNGGLAAVASKGATIGLTAEPTAGIDVGTTQVTITNSSPGVTVQGINWLALGY